MQSNAEQNKYIARATAFRDTYYKRYEFSEWVLDPKLWSTYAWQDTVVLYHKEDSLEDVQTLVTRREPCNIGLDRLYDETRLEQHFGYRQGAYKEGSPNFAILCTATVSCGNTNTRIPFNVKVINLIGCAHDDAEQPDYKHYDSLEKVRTFYKRMWQLAFAAAVRSGCKKMRVFNVGGGAFAGAPFIDDFERQVFKVAFDPLMAEHAATIKIVGYNGLEFQPAFVPHVLFYPNEDVENTLYVNAWDPWSLVGNGNAGDRSLDGAWGACSNMGVLCWPVTNPHIQYCAV